MKKIKKNRINHFPVMKLKNRKAMLERYELRKQAELKLKEDADLEETNLLQVSDSSEQ